jgi:hypothetical protein
MALEKSVIMMDLDMPRANALCTALEPLYEGRIIRLQKEHIPGFLDFADPSQIEVMIANANQYLHKILDTHREKRIPLILRLNEDDQIDGKTVCELVRGHYRPMTMYRFNAEVQKYIQAAQKLATMLKG